MKKYFLIIFGVILLFGATGCGKKNELTCSKTRTEGNEKIVEEVILKFNNKGKAISGIGSYTFSNEETAKSNCEFFKMAIDSKYADSISCTDKKITIKNLEKINADSDDEIKVFGMTRDEIIKLEESEEYSCK